MISFMNLLHVTLAKLIAGIYTVLSVFGAGIALNTEDPKTPEDFTPVLRFAVCSDIHLSGEEDQPEADRLAQMIRFMNDYSAAQENYDKFDALVVCGDFANEGKAEQYDLFNKIVGENLEEGTQLLTLLGNHEFINTRDYDASLSTRLYEEKMGREDDQSLVINGYHFILCSYDEDGRTYDDKKSWLNREVKNAVADAGDKPVFVFQHAAPFGTVYGSISWGDLTIAEVLCKYPSVIDFSGHSHYPVNDPRSIWQGGFTALGCGTLSYFETDLDGISGNFPYSTEQAAQFYIVEADAEGNVRILSYDLLTGAFFDNEYYLTGLKNRNFEYSYLKRMLRDNAPCFEDGTPIGTSVNEAGETVVTFGGAKDNYVVESYKVNVTKNGLPFKDDNFSGKYMYLFEEDVYEVNLGVLAKGNYRVSVVAMNAYTQLSKPLTYSFTVE